MVIGGRKCGLKPISHSNHDFSNVVWYGDELPVYVTEIYMQLANFPLILFSVMMILVQQPGASCCRLSASSGAANPTELEVAVVNLQEVTVSVPRMVPEFDLRLRIVAENGREPESTQYAKQLRDQGRGGSVLMIRLRQGESFSESLDLRKLYILNTGNYTVTVARDVFVAEKRIELQAKTTMKVP